MITEAILERLMSWSCYQPPQSVHHLTTDKYDSHRNVLISEFMLLLLHLLIQLSGHFKLVILITENVKNTKNARKVKRNYNSTSQSSLVTLSFHSYLKHIYGFYSCF